MNLFLAFFTFGLELPLHQPLNRDLQPAARDRAKDSGKLYLVANSLQVFVVTVSPSLFIQEYILPGYQI
jgi:hypothetical protein